MKTMRHIRAIAAILATLGLLVGCHKPVPTPTLTPHFDNMCVSITVTNVFAKGDTYTQAYSIRFEDAEAVTVTDHRGEELVFTLTSRDPDTQTAVIEAQRPLLLDGKEVTRITVGQEPVILCSSGENEAKDIVKLAVEPAQTPYLTTYRSDTEPMTMCYGDGVLLTLYPHTPPEKSGFEMAFTGEPPTVVCGTYTLEEDTLTLYENAGLSVTVLRRDSRAEGWCVDADASARHALSAMSALADDTLLSFGFAYEVEQESENDRLYRVKDFNGGTLFAQKSGNNVLTVTPLSPTVIRITVKEKGIHTPTLHHYLNTVTGELTTGYTDVYASSPEHIVCVRDTTVTVQELFGAYSLYPVPIGEFRDIASVALEGDTVTVFYRDNNKEFRTGVWNFKTAQRLEDDPLSVAGYASTESRYPYILKAGDAGFETVARIRQVGVLQDKTVLYLCGVEHAAIRIGEEYTELTHQDWNHGVKIDNMDFVMPPITVDQLVAQLKADVAAGLAVPQTHLDGAVTVYRYRDENRFHAITVSDTMIGRNVYVGDALAALEHIRTGEETREPVIKIDGKSPF